MNLFFIIDQDIISKRNERITSISFLMMDEDQVAMWKD